MQHLASRHPRVAAALIALLLAVKSAATAATIADLAADYRPGTTFGQTSDNVGIAGTTFGSWHYFRDTDGSPVTGTAPTLLTWQQDADFENGEKGYVGSDLQVGLPVPVISAERLFDGPNPGPPAGSIMGHPSNAHFLAVEYRNDSPNAVANLTIDYRFEKPNLFGSVTVSIVRGSGSVLFTKNNLGAGAANQTTSGTVSNAGTLAPNESVWVMLGANGGFEGDQSWMQVTLKGDPVPEPSAAALIGAGLCAMVGARRRGK